MTAMNGRARHCVVCHVAVLVGIAAGRARAAVAHWLTGLLGRLAGVALAASQLDLAAAGDGGGCFTMCFMLLVNCGLGHSQM